jgi:dipicolinate synthase subunit B
MELEGINIGFAMTGSFCTFAKTIEIMKKIVEAGANVIPIMSFNGYSLDTRFGNSKDFINEVEEITGNKVIHTLQEAEPIGPKKMTDIMIIAPATGNTIAKLANGITDTPVLMATKSHLRNQNNVLIGVSTNDALSTNAGNIGKLLNTKHIYFVPFRQDNPITKPNSLVFDGNYMIKAIKSTLDSKQLQPLIL